MSWITFIWSLTAGICLTLGAVHFLVWTHQRERWANLVFSFAATAAAGYAVLDMFAMRAQTPAEYAQLSRWTLAIGMLEAVSLVWFIRLYLRAGRLWLLWLICGLRALMLVLNFVPGPNFFFREITGLQGMPLLDELIARPLGVLHPWAILMPPSFLLIIIFVIDATRTASRQSRRAWVVGGVTAAGFSVVLVFYALYARGVLPSGFTGQLTLLLVVVMGYELSRDVLRAGELARSFGENEKRMKLATQAANMGVWVRDLERNEIWASDGWRVLLGFGATEKLTLENFFQRVHVEDREPTRHALEHVIASDGYYERDYRVVLPDGRLRWIASRGQAEFDSEGKPVIVRGVSLDITARKEAEIEMNHLRQEIAHVSRVTTMGQLASALAHEINQPLGAILRNTEAAELFLQQQSPDLDEIRSILADIRKDDQRASAVIDRMRALLRRRELDTQALDVADFVGDVAAVARPDATVRRVRLDVKVPTGLPQVRGDRVHLQQVLLNLIVNGMEALNGITTAEKQITVCARLVGNQAVEIAVSDSGPGIPEDQLAHVFDPFFTTKPNGMGMGLAISRTIVEAHGGRFWAENNEGPGATFRFTVKAAEDTAVS